MKKLDDFEKQIEKELEKGEWKRAKDYEKIRKSLEQGAGSVIRKKPVNIRLSERDIALLKKKSLETGIPYQTIIATLVRQYVEGKIRIEI